MTTAVDDLYLERLETLYEKQLSDTRAFAQREGRPFDEVRVHTQAALPPAALYCLISQPFLQCRKKPLRIAMRRLRDLIGISLSMSFDWPEIIDPQSRPLGMF